MARPKASFGLLVSAALVLASPALAQFGNIFRDEPPRPPADVPAQPPAGGPDRQPGYYPSRDYPPPRNYPRNLPQNFPPQQADVPPPQPLPAPMSLPPQARPGGGGIQSQDLAPPPGAEPTQQTRVPQQGQPGQAQPQQQQGTLSPLPGLPQGQRQPRGPPQQGSPDLQPGDEVVVEPPPQRINNPTAVFAGLDKITGRTISFDVAIDETVQFGALQVTPKVCYSRPPTETPQTDSFVEVDEVTLQGEIKRIFTGWMFAASPGLHAVEHPIYDVWLTDCKGGKDPAVADVSAGDQGRGSEAAAKPPAPRRPPGR